MLQWGGNSHLGRYLPFTAISYSYWVHWKLHRFFNMLEQLLCVTVMLMIAVIWDYAFVSTKDVWMHLFLNKRQSVTNIYWITKGGRGARGREIKKKKKEKETKHSTAAYLKNLDTGLLALYRASAIHSTLLLSDDTTSTEERKEFGQK